MGCCLISAVCSVVRGHAEATATVYTFNSRLLEITAAAVEISVIDTQAPRCRHRADGTAAFPASQRDHIFTFSEQLRPPGGFLFWERN